MQTTEHKQQIISEYARFPGDSGSPEVQVALLTDRIRTLTDHLRVHRHDYDTRRGLLMLVGRFMRLEAEYALGNKGRTACRHAMDFVVETSAFE